jgi:uncharacterized membrane protein YphA (DoxX/SURF4 family)
MNSILWIAQIVLAVVFLFAGLSKILVRKRQVGPLQEPAMYGFDGMPNELAAAIALLEIAAAVCVIVPFDLWPPDILIRLSASVLALLAIVAVIYHARRKEHTGNTIAAFLLALFVIIGRWPQ